MRAHSLLLASSRCHGRHIIADPLALVSRGGSIPSPNQVACSAPETGARGPAQSLQGVELALVDQMREPPQRRLAVRARGNRRRDVAVARAPQKPIK